MTVRTVAVLSLVLTCGVCAAVVYVLTGTQTNVEEKPRTTPVVVAALDITRGTPIESEFVAIREWPEGYVPPGAVTSVEDLIGRVALWPLVAGELVLESKVAEGGLGEAGSAEAGMRAFAIQTPSTAGNVVRFLPGNRVDILLTVMRSVEEGMKASELEHHQRWQRALDTQEARYR